MIILIRKKDVVAVNYLYNSGSQPISLKGVKVRPRNFREPHKKFYHKTITRFVSLH